MTAEHEIYIIFKAVKSLFTFVKSVNIEVKHLYFEWARNVLESLFSDSSRT